MVALEHRVLYSYCKVHEKNCKIEREIHRSHILGQFMTILSFQSSKNLLSRYTFVRYKNNWTLSTLNIIYRAFQKCWKRRESYSRNPPVNVMSEFWNRCPRSSFGYTANVVSWVIKDICYLPMGWVTWYI